MSPYCTVLLNDDTRSDVLAACIQADAAIRAGAAQAAATMSAGYWTFGAGVFAVIAAVIGGWLTLQAAKRQIDAAHKEQEQARQRRHDLKSQSYVAAVKAIAVGFGAVVRMANLEVRGQDVLLDYNDRAGDLFGAHLVAELETGALFLICIQKIGDMHRSLIKQRPFHSEGQYSREEIIEWSRRCTVALKDVLPSVTKAVGAMREELELRVDVQLYEGLIRSAYEQTLSANEQLFSTLVSKWDNERQAGRTSPESALREGGGR